MPQMVIPFKLPGVNPIKVSIGVGDEDARLKCIIASSAALGVDAMCFGWFGRDVTLDAAGKALLERGIVTSGIDPDFEFAGFHCTDTGWYDIPANTPFVILHATVNQRGLLIVETNVHRSHEVRVHVE